MLTQPYTMKCWHYENRLTTNRRLLGRVGWDLTVCLT